MSQHGQLGAIPPLPFLSVSPVESMRSGSAIPPPQKGYLSDTGAIPYENKANGCDTPLCDTISKGYCAIWGGISHWAAKGTCLGRFDSDFGGPSGCNSDSWAVTPTFAYSQAFLNPPKRHLFFFLCVQKGKLLDKEHVLGRIWCTSIQKRCRHSRLLF